MKRLTTRHLKLFADGFSEKISNLFALKTEIPSVPSSLPADGGDSATVNGHTVGADVPENAVFTDTTYSNMVAATQETAGKSGLVPAPQTGDHESFLRGDGTWERMEEATDEEIEAIIAGTFSQEG